MRNLVSAVATAAVTISFALLTACNGIVTPFSKPSSGLAPLGAIPLNPACENGKSGVGTQTPHTRFIVSGRYIEEKIGDKAPQKFFIKGMAYSPTPVGNGLSDPPSCNDPLRNDNKAIWSRDLPLIRAMGVNAIRVFNVVPSPWDEKLGTIDEFLDAAWNKGDKPIYVLMTIAFPGDALNNDGAAIDIAAQYERLAAKYALYPAVMGVSVSNELTGGTGWTTAKWWNNYSRIADGARRGFASKGVKKLVTSADFDGVTTFEFKGRKQIAQIYYGEMYHAKVDAWGDNLYRGRWFTDLLTQIQDTTTKPVILTEYGATAAYHPAWANTYEYLKAEKHRNGECIPPTGPDGPVNRDVAELPGGRHNPNMAGLVDYATNNAEQLYHSYKDNGLVSGGFYFEWTDEWWKADSGDPAFRGEHVGNIEFTGYFPGCGYDSAWFGLNSIKKGGGALDVLTPRPTLNALKATWAQQQP
ncbi:MAG TPA: hypothetical protein VIW73_10235 [Candidatus Cybelea sp.]